MSRTVKLVDSRVITAAGTVTDTYGEVHEDVQGMSLWANFTHGSGGTSCKAYVQTSFDGTNWIDVACFAFTTSSAGKTLCVKGDQADAAANTATDGSLSDDTATFGVVGRYIQVKTVSVGTYGDSTTLDLWAKFRG